MNVATQQHRLAGASPSETKLATCLSQRLVAKATNGAIMTLKMKGRLMATVTSGGAGKGERRKPSGESRGEKDSPPIASIEAEGHPG
jgi:hypothetical protein